MRCVQLYHHRNFIEISFVSNDIRIKRKRSVKLFRNALNRNIDDGGRKTRRRMKCEKFSILIERLAHVKQFSN